MHLQFLFNKQKDSSYSAHNCRHILFYLKECKKYFPDFYLLLIRLLQQRKHLLHFFKQSNQKNALHSDTDLPLVRKAKIILILVLSASDNGRIQCVYSSKILQKGNNFVLLANSLSPVIYSRFLPQSCATILCVYTEGCVQIHTSASSTALVSLPGPHMRTNPSY